MNIKE